MEWEGYEHSISVKKLKKLVIQQVAKLSGLSVGGDVGAELKAAYDKNFKPDGDEGDYGVDEVT